MLPYASLNAVQTPENAASPHTALLIRKSGILFRVIAQLDAQTASEV